MLSPRTFKKICADPRVADWSDERSAYRIQSNGIWLYLAPGWVTEDGNLTIHEQTVKECAYELMCTRYDPEAYVQVLRGCALTQALQGSQAQLAKIELLPGG